MIVYYPTNVLIITELLCVIVIIRYYWPSPATVIIHNVMHFSDSIMQVTETSLCTRLCHYYASIIIIRIIYDIKIFIVVFDHKLYYNTTSVAQTNNYCNQSSKFNVAVLIIVGCVMHARAYNLIVLCTLFPCSQLVNVNVYMRSLQLEAFLHVYCMLDTIMHVLWLHAS